MRRRHACLVRNRRAASASTRRSVETAMADTSTASNFPPRTAALSLPICSRSDAGFALFQLERGGVMSESSYLAWFRRVMWLGIIANVALALLSIFRTELVLELIGLPPASPLVWPRFASFLLILLSGFYVT